jgi:hypothetical protein
LTPDGQVGQEAANFRLPHSLGVAFAVEEDVLPNPVDVCPFCSATAVPDREGVSHLIEQARGLGLFGVRGDR